MSIEDFGDIVQIIATSAQIIFTFPYKIFNAEDINVYLLPVGSESNPPGNLLTLNTDYTVEFSIDTGGTVTLIVPATADDVVTLERAIPNSRDTDFENGGNNFTATTMNKQLDKLTAITSQVNTKLTNRGLLYNIDEKIGEGQTSLPLLPAGYFWKANGSGNLVAVEDTEESGCSTLRSELISQTEGAPGTDNIGMYDEESKSGKTLSEYIANLRPQKDDIPVVENKADPTKKIILNASSISTGQTREIKMPDNDVDLGAITTSKLPRGYIDGFIMANNATSPTDVIEIGDGECDVSPEESFDMISTDTFFCKVNLGWEAGAGADGAPKGKIAAGVTWTADTWYYVGVISKPDGTTDITIDDVENFSNTFTTPAVIAAGFSDATKYRRSGFLYAMPSTTNIRPFHQYGEWIWYDEPISTVTAEYYQPYLTATTVTVNAFMAGIPPAKVDVIFNAVVSFLNAPNSSVFVYFLNDNMIDHPILDQSNGIPPLASISGVPKSDYPQTFPTQIRMVSNSNQQIKYRLELIGDADAYFSMWTRAYKDRRGKR